MNSQKTFTQASVKKNIFDKAFVFSIALIIIVGGIWAAERILIYMLDRQIAQYEATTEASLASVTAEDVQKVHDITSRLDAIGSNAATQVKTEDLLGSLEKNTIPQVRLTKYEYESDGTIALSGVVSDYRFLAEQLLRYRQDPLFATAEVANTGRTDSGQVTFDIRAAKSQPEPVQVESQPVPSVTPPTQ